jgi:hypothetical protein
MAHAAWRAIGTVVAVAFRHGPRRAAVSITILVVVLAGAASLLFWPRGGAVEHVRAQGPAQAVFTYVGTAGQLRILQPGQTSGKTIAPSRHYGIIRLSPDGATVAALDEQSSGSNAPALHLIDIATGVDHVVTLAQGPVAALVWSPSEDVVAVVGGKHLLVNSAGVILATSANHSTATGGAIAISGGGYGWSPDGTRFGAVAGPSLVILSTNGQVRDVPTASLVGAPSQVGFVGWTASAEPEPVVSSAGEEFAVGPTLSTTSALGNAVAVQRVVDTAVGARGAAAAIKGYGTAIWDHPTSGGQVVAQMVASDGSAAFAVASVSDPSRFAVVSGLANSDTRGGALVDAILK